MSADEPTTEREPVDIELLFGISYANYLVMPRSVLQSMPVDWQHRFTALLAEVDAAFGHLDWPAYDVRALKRPTEVIADYESCPECDEGERDGDDCSTCNGSGETGEIEDYRYETAEEVGIRPDPIPHYNRCRTKLTPAPVDRGGDE